MLSGKMIGYHIFADYHFDDICVYELSSSYTFTFIHTTGQQRKVTSYSLSGIDYNLYTDKTDSNWSEVVVMVTGLLRCL